MNVKHLHKAKCHQKINNKNAVSSRKFQFDNKLQGMFLEDSFTLKKAPFV